MNLRDGIEKSATGTTTASYVAALTLELAGYKSSTILIQNETAQTMYYKIECYTNFSGDAKIEYVAETSIAASTTEEINITETAYAKAVISVKNHGGACVYDIEVIQHRLK